MNTIRTSIAYSLIDSYVGVLLQLVSTLIISRLLTPVEIGIFSVAAVLSALASTFRDFGVAEYLIQEKNLTSGKISAALAANIIVSWLMALALFGSSTFVADFYQQRGVADVMRVQSINFVLIPFGAVTMAYFRRNLNYRPILVANLLGNVTSFLVAVIAALSGLGYLSLAWASVAGVAVTVGTSILYRPAELPRFPSLNGLGDVVQFGKHASGLYLFGQVGKSAPEAIIGRVLDMASVAYFSRASGLLEIFNRTVLRAILPLCLPYFAQSARVGTGTQGGYLKAVALLTVIGWPFFVSCGIFSYPAIRILYGPQWIQTASLVKILVIAGMLELPYLLATEVMIAEGRIDQSNRLQFWVQSLRIAGLALFVPLGLTGACWGLVCSSVLGALLSHAFLKRVIGLQLAGMIKACIPSAIIVVLSCGPSALLVSVFPITDQNYLELFLVGAGLTGLAWVASLRILRHPFWLEIQRSLGHLLAKLRKRKNAEY